MKRILIATCLALVVTPAMSVDYRWTTGYNQGSLEAIIRNGNDSNVNIYCPSGQEDKTPGMYVQVNGVKPVYNEEVTVQIVVDGNNYSVYLREIEFKPVSRQDWWDFKALIKALALSKQKSFFVELPKYNKSETFSLLDARKSLGLGKNGVLWGCNKDSQARRPVAVSRLNLYPV